MVDVLVDGESAEVNHVKSAVKELLCDDESTDTAGQAENAEARDEQEKVHEITSSEKMSRVLVETVQ